MNVLGIESTCDETAVSIVRNGQEILSNVIISQSEYHNQFGGVYPEMAARQHVDAITTAIHEAIEIAGLAQKELDLIAVAKGPGLIGSLLIGMNAAKALSLAWDIPFIGVNHVEAHLYAAMMTHDVYTFPSLGIVVSGGHTFLTKIQGIGDYELIGTTIDDAVGEAFDKVATLLDLPYPGGPHIEALAKKGNAACFPFKAGRVKASKWSFSFSGLKTSVLYAIRGQDGTDEAKLSEQDKADIAASFQKAALGDIAHKAKMALESESFEAIYVGGGVSQNERLREIFQEISTVPTYFPTRELCLDNGAMIAGLGYHLFVGKSDPLSLEPRARMAIESSLNK